MLITENVLRKIIAEEYQKLINENSGLTDKEMESILAKLRGKDIPSNEEIITILDQYKEALKANAGQAFKFQKTIGIYDDYRDQKVQPIIVDFFEKNGIEAISPMGYDKKGKYNANRVPGEHTRSMSSRMPRKFSP